MSNSIKALHKNTRTKRTGICRNAPTRTESEQTGKSGPPSVNDCIGYSWSWILHVRTFSRANCDLLRREENT